MYQPANTIPQEILNHWSYTAIPDDRRQSILNFITDPDPSWDIMCPETAHPGYLMLNFAAADLLGIYDAPFYSDDPAGVTASRFAARYSSRIHERYHPWAQLSHALETAALLAIADEPDQTARWLQERRILASIPTGSHSDVAYHHLLQLFHITLRLLTGHSRENTPNPKTVALQLDTLVRSYAKPDAPPVQVGTFYYLLGLRVWAEAMVHHQTNPNLHRCNFELTPVIKAINDLHLTPPLYWMRAAFAAINTRAEHTELLDPKHLDGATRN